MKYASLFSGVEAATLAWEPLGFEPVAFAEIAPFPSAVLAERWPHVPNLGDITTVDWSAYRGSVDIVVGGSPCQSFSVAGLRRGLDDPRGNLALAYLKVVDRVRPRWVVWENVPGVLSSGRGRDFGAFLGALAKLGYGFAYRVLDAQHFGVPQRRRRVFVIGHSGAAWQRCAAVLFDGPSLRWDPQPRQQERAHVARSLTASTGGCSAKEQQYTFIDGAGEPLNALEAEPLAFEARFARNGRGAPSPVVPCLKAQAGETGKGDAAPLIMAAVISADAVRRLTPRECERLQGMPDDHTRVRGWDGWRDLDEGEVPAELEAYGLTVKQSKAGVWRVNDPDGPRYKAIGNSMAVPVMRWTGERLAFVDGVPDA